MIVDILLASAMIFYMHGNFTVIAWILGTFLVVVRNALGILYILLDFQFAKVEGISFVV